MIDESTPYRLVLVTCPDADTAQGIAEALVTARLAACVNVVGGMTSVYAWQGRIEKDAEHLLLIKSRAGVFDKLSETVLRLHPYELPEIVAVALDDGLPGYLAWIDDCLEIDADD